MTWKWIFLYCLFWRSNLPKRREDNFLIGNTNPKKLSNSGCDEKENVHQCDRDKNQYPGSLIKQFHKIPNRGHFSWVSGEPIIRKIIKSRSTDCHCCSSVVTTVVSWRYNISLVPLNLKIWFNHHIQYSVPQTFPIQPVQPPSSGL